MEIIYNKETLFKFKNKEAAIDEPILRSFLGINKLSDPLPEYWLEIQNHQSEKDLFSMFCLIFTHGEVIRNFANKYSKGNMKGVFTIDDGGKQYTNLRSALIESGASAPYLRRAHKVPYDFTPIFQNLEVGKLFKQVLIERITRITKEEQLEDSEFYKICFENDFNKAISLTREQFKSWLEGVKLIESKFINKVWIKNFYSISEIDLEHINSSKEVYFLGENGDGKSLILMAIYLTFNRHFITQKTDKEQTGKIIDILTDNKNLELKGLDSGNIEYGHVNVGYLNNFLAYGTHRGRYSTDTSEEYGFMSLFDNNETLLNPMSWLKDQKLLELEKNIEAKNVIYQDKSLPSYFSVKSLEIMFYDLLEKNVSISIEGSGIIFEEKGSKLNFDQLSEGYKSIIIFVSDVIFRLQKNQPKIKVIEDLSGIVLVDEIDLHLHPKWQKVIISKLRKLLPNVQFMFSTHSPSIIQGASDEAIIYRVYRNKSDGKTRVSEPYFRSELNHLMINTLLTSPLFGLDNSRLDDDNDLSNTSENYLIYRIHEKLKYLINEKNEEGEEFISKDDIDNLIQRIIDEEGV
ncbi:AAA family ATPase [Brumimicrobium mesophilum]|uniref:AAA family ATPase n=1 Tax=Brumimicrobium mesophilum TaxID=392717 RepID=UPI00131C7856|nr:AAA family ATPase [Brumimicrobium mesophilum]